MVLSFLILALWSSRRRKCCSAGSLLATEARSFFCFSFWVRERTECSHHACKEVCIWLQCMSP